MHNDVHIVSVIIYTHSNAMAQIKTKANNLPEAECHSNQDNTKLVLVFEAESETALSSCLDRINSWQGVLSTQLCYHHCEPNDSLQEEIQYAINAS